MVIRVIDGVFQILTGLKLNLDLVGDILKGGYEAFKAAKEALANEDEPTLEQIHAKAAELRDSVDL